MDLEQLIDSARDALTVKRVFGDPYEHNGVTVLPVARVQGGGGGGQGDSTGGQGFGGGGGLAVRPAGVYVLAGERVRWQPAVDVNRIVLGAQVVGVVALLSWRSVAKAWLKSNRIMGPPAPR